MKSTVLIAIFSSVLMTAQWTTPFEKGNGNQSPNYEQMVKYYDELDRNFENISIENFGNDDNGEPIKVVVYSNTKDK